MRPRGRQRTVDQSILGAMGESHLPSRGLALIALAVGALGCLAEPGSDAAAQAGPAYDPNAGLAYLLKALPHVLEGPGPEVVLVGIHGTPCQDTIARAAEASLMLTASGGPRATARV